MSMDTDLIRIPKRKESLNLNTGVFCKSVHFLDTELGKCVIVGIFKNRGDSLGVLFKGRKGSVFWSHDCFNQLLAHFNDVTLALEGKSNFFVRLDTGEDIKVNNVFGKQYVYVYDGLHTLSMNRSEWGQFIENLPLIYIKVRELFACEDLIKT
ncbi:hypothetical protein, partial [Klebsiella pneumoniae]|uniref:hypothetical protein n=1 Tax=Klebsiella pneumoniae TaxID=573 RepID=UPI001C8F5225